MIFENLPEKIAIWFLPNELEAALTRGAVEALDRGKPVVLTNVVAGKSIEISPEEIISATFLELKKMRSVNYDWIE